VIILFRKFHTITIKTAKYNYGDTGFIAKSSMLVKSYN